MPSPDTALIPAVVTRAGGPLDGPDSLVDAQVPAPAAPAGHDLLVEVRAVSVNPVDVKTRSRAAATIPDRILGWDASGVVAAVGDEVREYAVGDEVFYAGSIDRPGSYTARQLVDERIVGRKPASLTHTQAAALPLTAITAWEALFDKLRLGPDATGTLLVLGAAGGVGSILVQLAKTLTGMRVIATASRPASRAWVESLGADVVVDHSSATFTDDVLKEAPGGVDAVFTPQSRGRSAFFATVTRPFGQIVAIDEDPDMDILLLKSKALSWHWESMFARPVHGWDMTAQRTLLNRVSAMVDAGTLRTTLQTTYSPLNAATLRRAHADIESGHTIGKIVVTTEA